jgi:predicted RNA-binding protein YlxR (DUF448 family)
LLAEAEIEDADGGLSAARKGLERLCLASREVRPVGQMFRYVVAPDGKVIPDLGRELPGRGAWVTATRAALEKVIGERLFAHPFRGKGSANQELLELVEHKLERSALEALSLANKAGQVVSGFARVEALLAERDVAALIHASEAAADGVRKLDAAAHAAAAAGRRQPECINFFRGEQLDLALGRPNVVHAALPVHPASAGFHARCQRLDHWRKGGPAGEPAVSGARVNRR